MPYTNNQAKKDAKAAQKIDSCFGATYASSKPIGLKVQKENATSIQNTSISHKINRGKGSKDKVAPFREPSEESRIAKGRMGKAATETKGPKRTEAKSKVGKA